jgi:DNA end-binding protein Ku
VPKTKSASTRTRAPAKSRAQPASSRQAASPAAEGGRAFRPLWAGTLSFGLVSVPVELYPATRAARIGLRMLGAEGTPLARRFFCPEHDRELSSDDLVRGYEYKPGKYVQVTDEELEALEPTKSRDIDLQLFVPANSIDPVYFDRAFFLMPSGNSGKAYALLARVMERSRRAGIATFVLHDREYLVAIFARNAVLMAEALRFHDEVRDAAALGLPRDAKPDPAALKHYAALIAQHAHDKFDPTTLRNEHNEALRELASKKAKRKQDVVETGAEGAAEQEESGSAETIDLMRMLKQSLRGSGATH